MDRLRSVGPLGQAVRGRCDQAVKSVRWMTWRREAMKDVGTCEKLRGAGNQAEILRCPNGETHLERGIHA